jgi:hypothetical protein
MAIYHFSAKVKCRADGRSAGAAAAYRAAAELTDARTGQAHDYTAKAGVVHSTACLPWHWGWNCSWSRRSASG